MSNMPFVQSCVRLTDANGQIAWTFREPFTSNTPIVDCVPMSNSGQPYSVKQVSLSRSGCVFQILQSAAISVSLIGLTVLTALTNAGAGISCHLYASEPTE